MSVRRSILVLITAGAGLCAAAPLARAGQALVDAPDPASGLTVRQIRDDAGHEHNLYYYRDPWNADGSRMLGVRSDRDQKNWRLCLYDGDGVLVKELYTIDRYDWRACWDRTDPAILYTRSGARLYRLDVATGKADLLKDLAPLTVMPCGVSLNQAGDRILVVTGDRMFRSFRLSDMGEARSFEVRVPPGCTPNWDKPRYCGYRNYIDAAYTGPTPGKGAIVVYDDTGKVVHTFDGIGTGGHYDYSPDGKLAYFRLPGGPRGQAPAPLEIRVVNLDGTGDRVLFSLPADKCHFHNLHLSWPRKVNDWFVASFFPSTFRPKPPAGAAPVDEILMLRLDGTTKYLGHTGTVYSRPGARGAGGDMFWAQPLARPSADGRRIVFNSNRSGTIDLHILYPEGGPPRRGD